MTIYGNKSVSKKLNFSYNLIIIIMNMINYIPETKSVLIFDSLL